MANKSGTSSKLAREAYPSHILFEEQAGFYWLRGKDLAHTRNILPIKSIADSVGFDQATVSAFAKQLNKKGIEVGILKGNAVRTLQFRLSKKSVKVPCTTIGLAPKLLLGREDLQRLQACLTRKHSPLRDLTQKIRAELSNDHGSNITDFGRLYVYQVSEDIYEVDWELSTISKTTFEALALATHLAGKMLPCHLVLPKSKRKKNGTTPKPVVMFSEPVTYGQLRLPI